MLPPATAIGLSTSLQAAAPPPGYFCHLDRSLASKRMTAPLGGAELSSAFSSAPRRSPEAVTIMATATAPQWRAIGQQGCRGGVGEDIGALCAGGACGCAAVREFRTWYRRHIIKRGAGTERLGYPGA